MHELFFYWNTRMSNILNILYYWVWVQIRKPKSSSRKYLPRSRTIALFGIWRDVSEQIFDTFLYMYYLVIHEIRKIICRKYEPLSYLGMSTAKLYCTTEFEILRRKTFFFHSVPSCKLQKHPRTSTTCLTPHSYPSLNPQTQPPIWWQWQEQKAVKDVFWRHGGSIVPHFLDQCSRGR